jgi:hypothetical protein
MARRPTSVMRSAIRAPSAFSRQARPAYSRGAAHSASRPFFNMERNTALRAAAGSVLGALASPCSCRLALLRIRLWVSESFIVGVSGPSRPGQDRQDTVLAVSDELRLL